MFHSNAIVRTALLLTGVAALPLLAGCYGHASDVPAEQDTQAVRTRAAEVPLKKYFFVRSGSHFAAIMVDSQT